MRSISAKVIVWTVASVLLSLAGFTVVSQNVVGRSIFEAFTKTNSFHFSQARSAYEEGGPAALRRYLTGLDQAIGSQHFLADAAGSDLVSGEDRSSLVRRMEGRSRHVFKVDKMIVIGSRSGDHRYFWFMTATPPFSTWMFAPFYLILLVTVAGLYWLVSAHIASPLRRLASTVDRFGAGDLSLRAASTRSDEIGELGRSFNGMAGRIQTLLATERQLLQDVSHELRSPLARLTFAAEMVRKTEDRDAAADRLRQEVDRLSELVRTLIDMARAEGDPRTAEFEEIDLTDLLGELVDTCEVEAQAKGCRIAYDAPDPIILRGNRELLYRAFENVVRNAVRYAPEGSPVEVFLQKQKEEATISVRDYGPGIPENLLAKVFEPFIRADPSREETTGGLGLGLSIAQRAVRFHNGDIAASNAAPGARLQIRLPITQR